MKKIIIALLLCLFTCFSAGCNSSSNQMSTTGQSTTESVKECNHQWIDATCESAKKCSICGKTEGNALGHTTSSGTCSRCGEYFATAEDSVHYIADRSIQYDENGKYFTLLFSLQDENEIRLKAKATVDVRIVNDNGETVFTDSYNITEYNYSTWTSAYYGSRTLASIRIYSEDILPGSIDEGNIYFTVYNKGYFSFSESTLSIYENLPLKETTIILPEMPQGIKDYTYDGDWDTAVNITNITYEVKGDDLYIYFTGEKLYDRKGNKYSRACHVGWKLYDSEGYIIEDGTFYSPAIAVGEKFRNEKEIIWDCIKSGETYTLVLSDVS